MTTKKQEREALEQIKKILGTIDPDGWVRIAFDGVIEDAEQNIENDFGCSWKERAETAQEAAQNLQKALAAANEMIDKLQRRTLSAKDLDGCLYATRQLIQDREAKAAEAAAEIVRLADDTGSTDFVNAVKNNRFYAGMAKEYEEIESRVYKAYAASL